MKRTILLTLILILTICGLAYATAIKKATVTALNVTTYTAIINGGPRCNGFAVFTEDGTAYTYAVDSAGTGTVTVPANTFISFPNTVGAGDIALWALATEGTPNFVFQPGK